MSDYRVLRETAHYEVGEDGGLLIAACKCGGGWQGPNKGLGRAHLAAWESRHQHAERP